MSKTTLTVNGALGRMGIQVAQVLAEGGPAEAVSLWERAGHPALGQPHPALPALPVTEQWSGLPGDVVVDFTNEAGLLSLLAHPRAGELAGLVCGTTGLSDGARRCLEELAGRIPVFYSANMSLGIQVLESLARRAAGMLAGEWDVEIIETHHNRKADAPSGTANLLLSAIRQAWPVPLAPTHGRSGLCGPRGRGEIGLHAVRGGGVVGEHEILFAGPHETLALKHVALSRTVFAAGAVRAAAWLAGRKAGFYTMGDLLEPEGPSPATAPRD
jgi:4-hydroxy-tetrahydrodipicolinate reductase